MQQWYEKRLSLTYLFFTCFNRSDGGGTVKTAADCPRQRSTANTTYGGFLKTINGKGLQERDDDICGDPETA
jgi:hypothetical protein